MPSLKQILSPPPASTRASVGLLVLRVIAGSALMLHGLPKFANPTGWMGASSWAPGPLQALAAFSEVGGGIAIALGLLTPIASLGVLCTMFVAAVTHASKGDPFVGKGGSYELALVYLSIAVLMLTAGPGRFATDSWLFRRKS